MNLPLKTRISNAGCRLLNALVAPNIQSRLPIQEILNASDNLLAPAVLSDADRKTRIWKDAKLQELQYIGVTAALVSSLVGAAISWPVLVTGPWSARACWQASLILIVGSITIAAQQSISLYRCSSCDDGLKMIRRTLRGGRQSIPNAAGHRVIIPSWHYIYVWQLPAMMLRAGIVCFIIGTMALLWDAARGTEHEWNWDNIRVVIVFTVAEVFVLGNHLFSLVCIYPRDD